MAATLAVVGDGRGAGPVGLGLADEIRTAWPARAVTVVPPRLALVSSRLTGNLDHDAHRDLLGTLGAA